MRRFIAPVVLLLAPGLAQGVVAAPATATGTVEASAPSILTFPAEADATILAGSPSANVGTANELLADRSPLEESLLRFNVQEVGDTVTEATLRLYATNGSSDGPEVYRAHNGWQETAVTWGSRPQRFGGSVDDAGGVPTGSWLELDVTSVVSGNGPVSFNVVPTSSDGADFSSREALANQPELVVTSVTGGGDPDETAPETTITDGPSGTTYNTTATLAFTANEAADFECSLDGDPWAACTSSAIYADLEEGLHSFRVRAIDAAGNTDPTPATWIWTIDNAAPTVLTLPAKADAAILAGSPSANFGTTTKLLADATPLEESLLRFDVQGLGGPARKATLRLYATSGSGYGPEVYGAANDWEETTATWDDRPQRIGGAVAKAAAVSAGAWMELDVTSLVLGDGPVSFNLAPRSNDGADFSSREAATNGPQLVVAPERDPSPVVRESVATAEITEATSLTVGRPAGAAPGDVLVACVTINGGVASLATVGWTQFAEVNAYNNPKVYGYYRVVENNEPETWTWRLANRRGDLGSPYNPAGSYRPAASVGIARYSGVGFVDQELSYNTYRATPLDGPPVKGKGPTLRGPTTTAAGSKLVGCMGVNSSSHDVTITEPAGMDPAWDLAGKRQQLSDIDLGAAGQSPDRTWEFNSPRESAGWLIALRAG